MGYTAGEHKLDGNILLENGADIIIKSVDELYNYIKEYIWII